MFFSGTGGSGKSEVINQVLRYCSEFCNHLDVEFDSSTIRITALTGVAATLIVQRILCLTKLSVKSGRKQGC